MAKHVLDGGFESQEFDYDKLIPPKEAKKTMLPYVAKDLEKKLGEKPTKTQVEAAYYIDLARRLSKVNSTEQKKEQANYDKWMRKIGMTPDKIPAEIIKYVNTPAKKAPAKKAPAKKTPKKK